MKHMNAAICDTMAFATKLAFADVVMLGVSSDSLKISTVKNPLQPCQKLLVTDSSLLARDYQ